MDPISIAMALSQIAPSIIKWMTGSSKAEAVAEQVVDIARTVTGQDDPEEVLASLRTNHELAVQFRQAVLQHEAELERLYLEDRKDARARDVEFIKSGQRNIRADLMIVLDAAGLIACIAVLALYPTQLPPGVETLLATVASIFGLCLRDAHFYEFGSSRGSAQKTEALEKMSVKH